MNYYASSETAYINLKKNSGANFSIQFQLAPFLIRALAQAYAGIGYDRQSLQDAVHHVQGVLTNMIEKIPR